MNNYVATFFSHFDGLTFFNLLKERGTEVKLAPVPRKVSASCGTCVCFVSDEPMTHLDCEIEAVYLDAGSGYSQVWVNED